MSDIADILGLSQSNSNNNASMERPKITNKKIAKPKVIIA